MKTYDDFIAQVGGVPPLPQGIYGKVKFRVTTEKYVLPACFALPIFIFAGVFFSFFSTDKTERQLLDFLEESEEVAFVDYNFYSLFDD
jgi:hypothetical protein